MFSKKDSLPVIQALKIKDKDSTNLLLFLNEQKYRYRTYSNGLNTELVDSLFSLLNHAASLAIQFSVPVSKAQLTESKIHHSKSGLQKEIQTFLESIHFNSANMASVSIDPSTSFCNSLSYLRTSEPHKASQKEMPTTPLKIEPKHNSKSNNLSAKNSRKPIHYNNNKTATTQKFIFVNSMSSKSNKRKTFKSVDIAPRRNNSEYLFHNKKANKDKKGLTDIKPFHNATRLASKYLNVIDKYYSIKTEEIEKERSYSGGKSCSTFHH